MAAGVNSLSKTFVWILMGLLMLGLAGFGAVNLSGTVRTVATVGEETVSVDDYARELQQSIRAIEAQTGQTMQMSQARELGLDRLALSRLVSVAALDNETAQLGVSVGDETLQREIVAISAFQGADGNFDRNAYDFALDQAGLSEAEFEADLRKESARTLVQGAIVGGVKMPAILSDTLTDYVGARRSFRVALMTEADLDQAPEDPTDAQVSDFYEAHPDRFTLPRTRQLTYVLLSPEMLIDEVEVDDDAVRRLYEERETQYNQPERRLIERLVFADQAEAENAMAQIEVGGTTFENLVEDRGLSLEDVDLGDLSAAELGAAAEAAFAADTGAVVGPHETDLGPALFRINGTIDAQATAFEDVETELRDELSAERARRLIENRVEDISDLLAGGATLEELATETAMELGQIDWTRDSSDGVAAYAGFRAAAETVTAEDFPEILFLEDGSIFALRLDDELPPRPEPLEAARDKVIEAWRAAETDAALLAQAQAIADGLDGDTALTGAGLTVKVENGLTRSAFLDYAPDGVLPAVFDMTPGELRVVAGDGRAAIVRLTAVLPPDDTGDMAAMRAALGEQFDQALAQDLFDIFAQDARARAQPVLDQRALNAVQANFQ